jgi:phage terminase large subunit
VKKYKPHKYQKLFHDSKARFRTFIAGRRGGKSLTGTIEALKLCDRKPTNGMIIAPTYGMLKDVNISMMMDWCPEYAIESWNKVDMRLELVNGSSITFRSGDNPDRLRGTEKDWIWLDEACFMSKQVWETVYPVLTSTEGIAWVTTTPQGYDWVYQTFYKPAIDGDKNFDAWRFTTLDIPYINKDLVEQAKKDLSDAMFKQEYLASFEKFEGLIYPDFSEEKHVRSTPTSITDIFFVGLDVGWNHPTAGVLMKEDKERNLFVVDEFREQHLTPDMISNHLNSMLIRNELDMDKVEMFVIDPSSKGTQQSSGQSIMDQLREEGWGFIPGDNDVMAGINRITRLIKEDRFYVAPRCTMFVEEINNYHWKQWDEEKDGYRNRPFKLAEDLMDATRYVAQTRPDYFEHPQVDIYGRLVDEGGDPLTGYVPSTAGIFDPMGEEIDIMMSDDGIDNLM